jgi:hypothetical protein
VSGDHLFWLAVGFVKDIFRLDVIIIGRGQTKKSGLCFSFKFGDEKIEIRIATITLIIYSRFKNIPKIGQVKNVSFKDGQIKLW